MKLKRIKLTHAIGLAGLTTALVFGAGCASIVHGGARPISINSQPSGAKVLITKADTGAPVHSGVTPLTVSLEPKRGFFKGQSYFLKLEMAGYKTAGVSIRSELSGWYFGNIVFGGLIGMLIVDPATGAMWNLSPDKIEQTLSAEQAGIIRSQNGFVVALVEQTTAGERANMVRVN